MSKRGRYEFPTHVKESARLKWHKENPDRQKQKLQVHHLIPVWVARELNIPPKLVRVGNNAIAVTPREHKEIHRNELTLDEYKVLAIGLLGWAINML